MLDAHADRLSYEQQLRYLHCDAIHAAAIWASCGLPYDHIKPQHWYVNIPFSMGMIEREEVRRQLGLST